MTVMVSRSGHHEDTKSLLCFQHCDRHTNIVCFMVPEVCPLCHQNTALTESRVPPFRLSSPFTSSLQSSCCIAVKPTNGTFTRNYTTSANLHVGITDSHGRMFDFDEEGLHRDSVWPECLTISLLPMTGLDSRQWDMRLHQYVNPMVWTAYRYNEEHKNCFDFVLGFLHWLNLHHTFPEFSDKQSFITHFLLKRTTKVGQFISMYRQVEQFGFLCQTACPS
ncbi:MKRN2 opposite strand protein-like [Gigantopelta aegis]|uniref:MKRN2 opposite strand protein-like n=1 Tax=Gigantopelta aegis TaxID=1735272 RepID=UPI001B88A11C|nr:MKRN2 opposite strand protein-like [Gigantopelta aegis]